MTAWRELSDQELFDLQQEVDRRIMIFASQGVQFGGIDMHYIQVLLEEQMGERMLAAAREKHLLWLKQKLDEAEEQIRKAKITQGVAGFNGGPGHG